MNESPPQPGNLSFHHSVEISQIDDDDPRKCDPPRLPAQHWHSGHFVPRGPLARDVRTRVRVYAARVSARGYRVVAPNGTYARCLQDAAAPARVRTLLGSSS
eukprot:COSAG02_NODE_1_length_108762_cov_456.708287_33_plen_102_part_00